MPTCPLSDVQTDKQTGIWLWYRSFVAGAWSPRTGETQPLTHFNVQHKSLKRAVRGFTQCHNGHLLTVAIGHTE